MVITKLIVINLLLQKTGLNKSKPIFPKIKVF